MKELPLLTQAGICSCFLIQLCSVPDTLSDKGVQFQNNLAQVMAHMAHAIDSSVYLHNRAFMLIESPRLILRVYTLIPFLHILLTKVIPC